MAERLDARPLNWRFVVPGQPDRILLLPVNGERVDGAIVPDRIAASLDEALKGGPYPGVAVPDVGSWSPIVGSHAILIRRLAAAVERGGWLYAGFANALYPGHPFAPGSLRAKVVRRSLAISGVWSVQTYFPLPDHRCPAYLIPAERREEMNYFLRTLFLPYREGGHGWPARVLQRGRLAMRAVALAAPVRTREHLAPAIALVARRAS
jgi:hypothetical protein